MGSKESIVILFGPYLLVFTALYKYLSLSVESICNLILTNGIWQRFWNSPYDCIILLKDAILLLETSRDFLPCREKRPIKQPLGAKCSLYPIASTKARSSVLQLHGKFCQNVSEQILLYSRFQRRAQLTLDLSLDPKQYIPLSRTTYFEIINKCILFCAAVHCDVF